MRKPAAVALGLVFVLMLCAWGASKYIVRGGKEDASAVAARETAPSLGGDSEEHLMATSSDDHGDHEAPTDDPGVEALMEGVAEHLAREANDILHAKELPAPPTVEEVTRARLKSTDLAQTIHGEIADIEKVREMLDPGDKPLRVYARTPNGRTVSASTVVDGKFSLGQVPSGAYTVFVAERNRMPGLVMEMNVDQDQQAQKVVFGLGECDVEVTVLDETGRRVESDTIRLFLGGTDDEKHMFKRAKSIRNGTWRVNGLLSGPYMASAEVGGVNGGALLNLEPGMNACTIQMGPRAVAGEGPEHSSEPLPR